MRETRRCRQFRAVHGVGHPASATHRSKVLTCRITTRCDRLCRPAAPRETGRGDSGGEEDSRKRVRWPCADAAGGGHAGNVSASPTQELAGVSDAEPVVDAGEPVRMLQQEVSAGAPCLSSRDAARRFQVVGPNESPVHRRRWAADLARHVTHPLAPLVWVAAGLSWMVVATNPAIAVLTVVLLNAAVARIQQRQSEGTVEAHGRIGGILPHRLLLRSMVAAGALGAAVIYPPAVQSVFGTENVPVWVVLTALPFPVTVWSADGSGRRT